MSDKSVGFIGAGIMGVPMATNLQGAGFALRIHSRTKAKAQPLLDAGAVWCDSPRAVAEQADVIISIVSDTPDVEAVYLGEQGVIHAARVGMLCIDMSTIAASVAVHVATELGQHGVGFLDAPVSGGKTGAEQGTLVVMAGGNADDIARATPLFNAMSRCVVHCGPVGHGQLTKACNQILCAVNLLGVAEAMVFAKKVGLDVTKMLEAVSGGAAASWALQNLGARMIKRDFAPMFMIDLQQKDLRIALSTGDEDHIPLAGTALVHQLLQANQATGEGRLGTQALVKVLERLAGIDPEHRSPDAATID